VKVGDNFRLAMAYGPLGNKFYWEVLARIYVYATEKKIMGFN
jgi:hypothetical protein